MTWTNGIWLITLSLSFSKKQLISKFNRKIIINENKNIIPGTKHAIMSTKK